MVQFICDGCEKKEQGFINNRGQYFKPHNWFQRTDSDGTQLACSRECIDTIAQKTGKTRVIVPL